LRGEIKERGGGDAGTSATTSDPQAGAPRSPATLISPKGDGGTASISLSLLLHDVTDIASSLLRELDAVALATNVTVFMEGDTKEGNRVD